LKNWQNKPLQLLRNKLKLGLKAKKKRKKKKKKKGLLWIGSIFIISGLAVVAWVGRDQITEAVGWNKSDIAEVPVPEETHPDKTPEVETPDNPEVTPQPSDTVELESDPIIEPDVEIEDPIVEKEEPVVEKEEPNPPSSGKLYHIIGGAFSSEDNAKVFVDDLKSKGYPKATLLGRRNGLYTVSFGGYSTKDGAKAQLKLIKAKDDNDGGWILYY